VQHLCTIKRLYQYHRTSCPYEQKLKVIRRYQNQLFDAAAGIYSSVNDLSKWAIMQMNNGNTVQKINIIFEKEHDEMWQSKLLFNQDQNPYNTISMDTV
jgi:CubicO group peptidase (beta-lactamase class C family)